MVNGLEVEEILAFSGNFLPVLSVQNFFQLPLCSLDPTTWDTSSHFSNFMRSPFSHFDMMSGANLRGDWRRNVDVSSCADFHRTGALCNREVSVMAQQSDDPVCKSCQPRLLIWFSFFEEASNQGRLLLNIKTFVTLANAASLLPKPHSWAIRPSLRRETPQQLKIFLIKSLLKVDHASTTMSLNWDWEGEFSPNLAWSRAATNRGRLILITEIR